MRPSFAPYSASFNNNIDNEISQFVQNSLQKDNLTISKEMLLFIVRKLYQKFMAQSQIFENDGETKRTQFDKIVFKFLKRKYNLNVSSLVAAVGPWRSGFLKQNGMLVS